jgi:hypothetical protein
VIDIYGAVQDATSQRLARHQSDPGGRPEGAARSQIIVRGQIETMTSSFVGMLGASRSRSSSSTR